jgi:chromate reductase, NAD(P)H dehydrogenase (quinone)
MSLPKILVIPGALQAASCNGRLAALATKELILADAEVTRISLMDYPLPIYDPDLLQNSDPPRNAIRLKQLMSAHHGVFIASPEYNASVAPVLKNAIDWISVAREAGEPARSPYHDRVFALGGASAERSGAVQSLAVLRQVLAVGCGAMVLSEQISVANADQAFDEMDELTDPRAAGELKLLVHKLIEAARLVARR